MKVTLFRMFIVAMGILLLTNCNKNEFSSVAGPERASDSTGWNIKLKFLRIPQDSFSWGKIRYYGTDKQYHIQEIACTIVAPDSNFQVSLHKLDYTDAILNICTFGTSNLSVMPGMKLPVEVIYTYADSVPQYMGRWEDCPAEKNITILIAKL